MTFSLALDFLITCLLAGMIFYAVRLSHALSDFRKGRAEMVTLLTQLNAAMTQAHQAIHGLKSTAETSGADLQKIMRTGTDLADELQIMIETGNNLATRLEQGARGGLLTSPTSAKMSPLSAVRSQEIEESSRFNFSIRDPEFDGGHETRADFLDIADEDGFFMSEAERELHRALRASQKMPRQIM